MAYTTSHVIHADMQEREIASFAVGAFTTFCEEKTMSGPFNKDLQQKVGEPYVERWVRLTASIDIPVDSVDAENAVEIAQDDLRIATANKGWDCEITDSKILEDE